MVELVVRVVLEAHGGSGHPLGMLLGNTFSCDTSDMQLLALAQLGEKRARTIQVGNDGVARRCVDAIRADDEVTSVDVHDLVTGTLGMQRQDHGTLATVTVAVALAGEHHLLDVARVEWDETQAVGNELIGEDRGVCYKLD
jgi:hypothetical protein